MTLFSDLEKHKDSQKNEVLDRLKNECASMTRQLKKLKDEEELLSAQNDILAREIIDMGYTKYNIADPVPSSMS